MIKLSLLALVRSVASLFSLIPLSLPLRFNLSSLRKELPLPLSTPTISFGCRPNSTLGLVTLLKPYERFESVGLSAWHLWEKSTKKRARNLSRGFEGDGMPFTSIRRFFWNAWSVPKILKGREPSRCQWFHNGLRVITGACCRDSHLSDGIANLHRKRTQRPRSN